MTARTPGVLIGTFYALKVSGLSEVVSYEHSATPILYATVAEAEQASATLSRYTGGTYEVIRVTLFEAPAVDTKDIETSKLN